MRVLARGLTPAAAHTHKHKTIQQGAMSIVHKYNRLRDAPLLLSYYCWLMFSCCEGVGAVGGLELHSDKTIEPR